LSRAALTHTLLCIAVFGGALFFLWTLVGDCFHPSLDEGIYLEGGERILEGQVPYRDFFAFTGPLTYWIQAGLQKTFGREMPPLRLSATASLALMTLVVFAITSRLTDWGYGLATAVVYLSYLSASTYMIIVNHRWLSAALACLALWAAVEATGKAARAKLLWIVAGAAAAAAAWATPSFLPGIGLYLVWLALRDRQYLVPFCSGILLVSVPAIGWLAANGALMPMIDSMLWVTTRYSKANVVPYGFNSGGPGPHWDDVTLSLYTRIMLLIGLMRYYIAPVGVPVLLVTYGFLAWRKKLDTQRQLLVLVAAAIFSTTYPRWDLNQMLFTMAPFVVLMALLAFRLPLLAQPPLAVVLFTWAFLNYSSAWRVAVDDPYFPTRAGMQRGPAATLTAYERLERLIPEGSTLFAFPYLPSLGYALHTRNPVRYAFMQPGMMSKQDEAQALSDLERQPPRFILRQFFPDDQVLNIWPSSDRSTMAMNSIREFIDRRYRFIERIRSNHFEVEVMELTR
jgi:4-amino-4-deoxy-L-arabinose transferase-like glycosyltransferase